MGSIVYNAQQQRKRPAMAISTNRVQREPDVRIWEIEARIKTVMIKRILKAIFGPRMTAEEKYLSQSADHQDLERRQRELDRRQFGGNQFKFLYNRFYL